MRCAVSERMGTGMAAGHRAWLDSFRQNGIEFVVVPDSGGRNRRPSRLPEVDAVLLAEASTPCAPGAGTQDGRDVQAHRTERELVRLARARRLPLVAIGHGAEFLGRYFGARLVPRPGTGGETLALRFAPGHGPHRATAQAAGRMVCDPHSLPAVLVPVAWDEHDQIAGFVHRDEPILGIHWQPVDPDDGATRMVLEALHAVAPTGGQKQGDPLGITNG